jgi:hypothetical protein
MNDPALQPAATAPGSAGAASRLVTWGAGGLSLLLVLALALAAGVPAGRLLATVGGGVGSQGDLERAVAPQIVERQARRAQQERPVPAAAYGVTARGVDSTLTDRRSAALCVRPAVLVREALLALPPPAV